MIPHKLSVAGSRAQQLAPGAWADTQGVRDTAMPVLAAAGMTAMLKDGMLSAVEQFAVTMKPVRSLGSSARNYQQLEHKQEARSAR